MFKNIPGKLFHLSSVSQAVVRSASVLPTKIQSYEETGSVKQGSSFAVSALQAVHTFYKSSGIFLIVLIGYLIAQ